MPSNNHTGWESFVLRILFFNRENFILVNSSDADNHLRANDHYCKAENIFKTSQSHYIILLSLIHIIVNSSFKIIGQKNSLPGCQVPEQVESTAAPDDTQHRRLEMNGKTTKIQVIDQSDKLQATINSSWRWDQWTRCIKSFPVGHRLSLLIMPISLHQQSRKSSMLRSRKSSLANHLSLTHVVLLLKTICW